MQVKFVLDEIDLDYFGSSVTKKQENKWNQAEQKEAHKFKNRWTINHLVQQRKAKKRRKQQRKTKTRKPFTLRQKQQAQVLSPTAWRKIQPQQSCVEFLFHFEKIFACNPNREEKTKVPFFHMKKTPWLSGVRPEHCQNLTFSLGSPAPELPRNLKLRWDPISIFSKKKPCIFIKTLKRRLQEWRVCNFDLRVRRVCRTEAIECWRKRGRYQEGTSTSLEPRTRNQDSPKTFCAVLVPS